MRQMERRRFLRLVGTTGVAGTAVLTGCTGGNETDDGTEDGTEDSTTDGGDDEDGTENDGTSDPEEGTDGEQEESTDWRSELPEEVDVIAGPRDKGQVFEPEEIEITVGETVVWYFDTSGHNVTSHPEASYKCENPEGAEPFKSYEGNSGLNDKGSTFSHTFETPGEYTYVCAPHSATMVGHITVTES